MRFECLYNNQQYVKDITNKTQGVLLLFEIPPSLNPKLPSIDQSKKDDNNNGVD